MLFSGLYVWLSLGFSVSYSRDFRGRNNFTCVQLIIPFNFIVVPFKWSHYIYNLIIRCFRTLGSRLKSHIICSVLTFYLPCCIWTTYAIASCLKLYYLHQILVRYTNISFCERLIFHSLLPYNCTIHYKHFDLELFNIILYSITYVNFCLSLSTWEYFF